MVGVSGEVAVWHYSDAKAQALLSAGRWEAPTIVMFSVGWCEMCRLLHSQLKALERYALPLVTGQVKPSFVKIDVDRVDTRILAERGITDFPNLRFYSGERNETYHGSRDSMSILRWIGREMTADVTIPDLASLKRLLRLHATDVSVLFVNPTDQMRLLLQILPDQAPEVLFATVTDTKLGLQILDHFGSFSDDANDIRKIKTSPRTPYVVLFNPFATDGPDLADPSSSEEEEFLDEALSRVGKASSFHPVEGDDEEHREYKVHVHVLSSEKKSNQKLSAEVQKFIETFRFPTLSRWTTRMGSQILASHRSMIVAFSDLFNPRMAGGRLSMSGRSVGDTKDGDDEDDDDESGEGSGKLTQEDMRQEVIDILWDVAVANKQDAVTVVAGSFIPEDKVLRELLGIESVPALAYVTLEAAQPKTRINKWRARKEIANMLSDEIPPEESRQIHTDAVKMIQNWLADIRSGKVPQSIKSEEPLPDNLNKGPVYHLTALDFDERVLRSSEAWIVDFYAPWCGHCRVMAPVYEHAARTAKALGINVKFAKIDATQNEVSAVRLFGYPTLMFYPEGRKDSSPHMLSNTFGNVRGFFTMLSRLSPIFRLPFEQVEAAIAKTEKDYDDLPKIDDEL